MTSPAQIALPRPASVLAAIFALGVSCVVTQLVLMREMLCVFSGNELVLGVVLGNWLLLMGLGTWLGRRAERLKNPTDTFLWTQILIAILPLAQVMAVRMLRIRVFPRGLDVGLIATVATSFLVLLPFCLAAGFLLALACHLLSRSAAPRSGAGQVYVADTLGSIAGGLIYSLVLAWVVNSFAVAAGLGLLILAITAWLAWECRQRKWTLATTVVTAVFIPVLVLGFRPDRSTTTIRHWPAEILFRGNSPYGQLVVTRLGEQINFIQNGLPVLATHNIEQVEEAVHYAMAQRPDAQQVLLVGGGVAGTARELLKYRADVTYVELDPLFLEQGRRFLPENLADPRIQVVNTDGRRFVQTTHQRFDVIIVDLADPATAQLNRFHTVEFFAEARRVLTTNGVLAVAVGRYENYVSPELARMLATEHRTLRSAFANVVMLPGGRVFFLASDGPLGLDIADRLVQAGVPTRFVNRHYLDAVLTPDRLAALERAVTVEAPANRDFNPVLYFQCLRHWASQFNFRPGWLEVALGLALLVYLIRLRGSAIVVFAGGFAASSLEVVLLLGFQALCGSLYYQLGIIVTVFMAGLAVGAAWANRRATGSFGGASSASPSDPGARVTRPSETRPCESCDSEDRPSGAGASGAGAAWANRRATGSFGGASSASPSDSGARVTGPSETHPSESGPSEACPSGARLSETRNDAEFSKSEERTLGHSDFEFVSDFGFRISDFKRLVVLAIAIAWMAVLLPPVLTALSRVAGLFGSALAVQLTIGLLTFALAALVGAEFPLANRIEFDGTNRAASRIYTADFMGAFLGALLASTLLIPLLGVTGVCLLTAVLNLVAGASLYAGGRARGRAG